MNEFLVRMIQLIENGMEVVWLHGVDQFVQSMALLRQNDDHREITAQIWQFDPTTCDARPQRKTARTKLSQILHHRHHFRQFFGGREAFGHRFVESVLPFAAEVDGVGHQQFDAALRIRLVDRWDLIFGGIRDPIVDDVVRFFDAVEIHREYFNFARMRLSNERIVQSEVVVGEYGVCDAQFTVTACVVLQLGHQFGDHARIDFANRFGDFLLR